MRAHKFRPNRVSCWAKVLDGRWVAVMNGIAGDQGMVASIDFARFFRRCRHLIRIWSQFANFVQGNIVGRALSVFNLIKLELGVTASQATTAVWLAILLL